MYYQSDHSTCMNWTCVSISNLLQLHLWERYIHMLYTTTVKTSLVTTSKLLILWLHLRALIYPVISLLLFSCSLQVSAGLWTTILPSTFSLYSHCLQWDLVCSFPNQLRRRERMVHRKGKRRIHRELSNSLPSLYWCCVTRPDLCMSKRPNVSFRKFYKGGIIVMG